MLHVVTEKDTKIIMVYTVADAKSCRDSLDIVLKRLVKIAAAKSPAFRYSDRQLNFVFSIPAIKITPGGVASKIS